MREEEAKEKKRNKFVPLGRNEKEGEKKGGFRAATFVYVYAGLESVAFTSNCSSLVLYFLLVMHFDVSKAANTLTNFLGSSFLLSVIGGFISDTYLTQYTTCLIFIYLEIMGLAMLTIQAHTPALLPTQCSKSSCVDGGIALMLYGSLYILALGWGAMKGSLFALGANQFDEKDSTGTKNLSTYFNSLLFSACVGSMVGVTVIVWVTSNTGWWQGFLICTSLVAGGYICLAFGKPFYKVNVRGNSPIIRVVQVVIVSFKNRNTLLPLTAEELYENNSEEQKISHSQQFRFLNKAAVLPEGVEPIAWTVCTVTQVEEVKILIRMLPIVASTILVNTCSAQLQTFSVQQGKLMNRYLGKFQVPASSIPFLPLVSITIIVPLYDHIFIPFVQKITGHTSGITQLQRVGVGLVLSAISMAAAALIEIKRKNNYFQNPSRHISLFWLSIQYGIFGLADIFSYVGCLEFFYREAPPRMKSLSISFLYISISFGYYLSSIFVDITNAVTRRVTPSKLGWLHGHNLNENNLDLFYWLLALISCSNFGNYLYWACWYKYNLNDPKVEYQAILGSVEKKKDQELEEDGSRK